MTKAAPWFRFFPGDWIAGTDGLSALEEHVYFRLVVLMYDHSEAIPAELANDQAALARRCKMQPCRFKAVLKKLIARGSIIRFGDGRLSNRRFEEEMADRTLFAVQQSARSRARWHEKDKETNGRDIPSRVRHIHKGKTLPTAESFTSRADAREAAPAVTSLEACSLGPPPQPDAPNEEFAAYYRAKALNGRKP